MNDTPSSSLLDQLQERLSGDEDLEWEFKAAQGNLPRDLWPTISAFANTAGGWIVLGVREQLNGFHLIGIRNPALLLKDLHAQLRNQQKISYATCGAEDVSVETLGDKSVIVVRVPAAPRTSRPVYIDGSRYTGTYVRRDSGDYHCTQSEVDRMVREAGATTADATILPHFTLDDLDDDALRRYRRRFQTQDPGSYLNGMDDTEFLRAVGGYGEVRGTGQRGPTIAGLLVFGTPPAIREIRTRHVVDYRKLVGEDDPARRWEDRVHHNGNLYNAFEIIFPRLAADLPAGFMLRGATRVDETSAHTAMREALVNLLVHADYTEMQASLIEHSQELYLFRNPGDSRVSERDLLLGNRSDPRNPIIVDMFRRIGLAEDAGTGIRKIVGGWRRAGFQRPEIDIGTERYEFSLRLRSVHLIADEDIAWLLALGDDWSEPEQLALVTARHEGDIDNPRLRRRAGLLLAEATKVLTRLRDRGFLLMVGGKRGARYQLGQATEASNNAAFPATVTSGAGFPRQGSSDGSIAPATIERGNSQEGIDDYSRSTAGSGGNTADNESSSADIDARLELVAARANNKYRLTPMEREEIVLSLCSIAPLSINQLSSFLGRSPAHLRSVLRELIAAGHLQYLYPNAPRHPLQRYMTSTAHDHRAPGT